MHSEGTIDSHLASLEILCECKSRKCQEFLDSSLERDFFESKDDLCALNGFTLKAHKTCSGNANVPTLSCSSTYFMPTDCSILIPFSWALTVELKMCSYQHVILGQSNILYHTNYIYVFLLLWSVHAHWAEVSTRFIPSHVSSLRKTRSVHPTWNSM